MKKFYSVILWGICIAAAVGLLIFLGSLMSDESMTSEKPVIYLYPEKEQEVSVRLDYDGELTCTYPEVQRRLDSNGGTGRQAYRPDGKGIQLSVLGRNIRLEV